MKTALNTLSIAFDWSPLLSMLSFLGLRPVKSTHLRPAVPPKPKRKRKTQVLKEEFGCQCSTQTTSIQVQTNQLLFSDSDTQTEDPIEEVDKNYMQGWNDAMATTNANDSVLRLPLASAVLSGDVDTVSFAIAVDGTQFFCRGVRKNSLLYSVAQDNDTFSKLLKHAPVEILKSLNLPFENRTNYDMVRIFRNLNV